MRKYNTWTILLIIIVVVIIAPHLLKFVFSAVFVLIVVAFILFILKKYGNENGYNKMDRMFMSGEVKATDLHNKYDFTFSSVILDCAELVTPLQNKNMKVDVTFSKCVIKINPNVPALIRIDSSFANVTLPNNTRITFGEQSYEAAGYKRGLPYFYIKVDVAFSDVKIIENTN
ncbi:hypothetical protein CPAST_c29240 [Clostridium pasteurianum DSM 525 = ATCC 6013]|uniref:Cell wall-active antibiotics response LiaF-like C-terminal domain-containing protein n=1 Tax=Clostridium pasteurianum DSM 525 = ATCC 6013 TaxID=1262449 RepID=A0A0H3JB14_CLOPA|nr:hypothetical protein [Clostridium pasteurianum]AJA48990.1 hypothetical protein CPAST_c29240 [Clostridium pasteurianum DSM 525 = ATCC 6013]AJA52978.1 hypothetical protein CLPA_c29240 [Clostridium pasteurianum DSM 525 = ATCC 6013]AOZ76197.1 hypothetical protein AQ983_14215 [Clostridium pasteurianum DSM 525 = ATCC 6013]AOZ79993.1 hypothetical protein AQ984_14210 [Clostridium pasteurianum]ELP60286.1 hypothetical protein F502_06602 [Clostridium pasteurianum DSM 525 = ATCC 6013]